MTDDVKVMASQVLSWVCKQRGNPVAPADRCGFDISEARNIVIKSYLAGTFRSSNTGFARQKKGAPDVSFHCLLTLICSCLIRIGGAGAIPMASCATVLGANDARSYQYEVYLPCRAPAQQNGATFREIKISPNVDKPFWRCGRAWRPP